MQETSKDCLNCPERVSLGSIKKIPVYVPIPVFTMYQIPIIHHYPVNQIVRQVLPLPIEIPIEHRINKPVVVPIPIQQKIIVPQPVPYGVKVPIPIPIFNNNSNIEMEKNIIKNLVSQKIGNEGNVNQDIRNNVMDELKDIIEKPINGTLSKFSIDKSKIIPRLETKSDLNDINFPKFKENDENHNENENYYIPEP